MYLVSELAVTFDMTRNCLDMRSQAATQVSIWTFGVLSHSFRQCILVATAGGEGCQ